ncbi:hypothetical protein GCM10027072_74150 [Streptomyces bullii]
MSPRPEAYEGEEAEGCCPEHTADQRVAGALCLELTEPGRFTVPGQHRPGADREDDEQAAELEKGEDHIGLHRLRHAPQVQCREGEDEQDRDEGGREEVRELGEVVTAEGAGGRTGRGQARAHDHEGDDEREERDAERLLRVKAAPAALGYLPTSSTYEAAVRMATTNPMTNGSHSAPPTFPAT